jgi:DNA-binding CsgD family transcriptional regulator
MRDFIAEGWMERNERAARLIGRHHAGFLCNLDLFATEEIEALPVYSRFLTPRGLSAGAGSAISGPGDDALILTLEGFRDQRAAGAAIKELDQIRPHLARAAMLSARLQFEKAKAAMAVLESIGAPAAVVDHRGALMTINSLFEPEIGDRFVDTRASLRLRDEHADYRLHEALEKVRLGLGGASIPIRGRIAPARALHILPVRGEGSELFSAASAVLVVARHKANIAPSRSLLEQLYDLSPAEARVAQGLADGASLREIADRGKTSIHTVRNQSKAVLEKTGAAGQTHLIKLLMNLSPPPTAEVRLGS